MIIEPNTEPRVTLDDVEANIVRETYFTGAHGHYGATGGAVREGDSLALLTFCVLTLQNGFTVTGESACASIEDFSATEGRKLARERAVKKVWSLMAYALKDRTANALEA